jgi:Holliday junction DNA helicase RuvA
MLLNKLPVYLSWVELDRNTGYHSYMIAQLTGKIVNASPMRIVLDVHGVGYLIGVTGEGGFVIGAEVTLYTHLAVRENAMDLYGFETRDELAMFNELIKLQKIGPKTAMQILSQASLDVLTQAIRTDDPTYLSKMSGIGKKSAEKIVAGLRDVLDTTGIVGEHISTQSSDTDVLDALITLGYSQREALLAVQKIPADITEANARIKHALKYISG